MNDVDVDAIILELQDRVWQRRQGGDYPLGLEEQLEAEFASIMQAVHRHEVDTEALRRFVTAVEESIHRVSGVADTGSRLPGGAGVHAVAARIVQRHTGELAESVRELGAALVAALWEVRHLIDLQRGADERQLHEVVESILDRVAVIDHVAEAVLDLERRVAALEDPRRPFPA